MTQGKLKPKEFAAKIGVTKLTVMKWIKAGKIDALMIGSRYWIDETEIDKVVRKYNA